MQRHSRPGYPQLLRQGREKGINMRTIKHPLIDPATDKFSGVTATLQLKEQMILIGFSGYGEHDAQPGQGTPILLEVLEGKLRLLVWADINSPNPTHIIDLSGAAEAKRKEP